MAAVEDLQESRNRIAAIVRGVLEGMGRGQAVPVSLIDAVVEGTGDPAAVARATREVYGGEKPFDLVLFDTDHIGGYVFESSRPPVIAGASLLLRKLNQQ